MQNRIFLLTDLIKTIVCPPQLSSHFYSSFLHIHKRLHRGSADKHTHTMHARTCTHAYKDTHTCRHTNDYGKMKDKIISRLTFTLCIILHFFVHFILVLATGYYQDDELLASVKSQNL